MELVGCGPHTITAVKDWLSAGGLRLDAADSYDTQFSVGVAMAQSGVPRESIFVLQKTGNCACALRGRARAAFSRCRSPDALDFSLPPPGQGIQWDITIPSRRRTTCCSR